MRTDKLPCVQYIPDAIMRVITETPYIYLGLSVGDEEEFVKSTILKYFLYLVKNEGRPKAYIENNYRVVYCTPRTVEIGGAKQVFLEVSYRKASLKVQEGVSQVTEKFVEQETVFRYVLVWDEGQQIFLAKSSKEIPGYPEVSQNQKRGLNALSALHSEAPTGGELRCSDVSQKLVDFFVNFAGPGKVIVSFNQVCELAVKHERDSALDNFVTLLNNSLCLKVNKFKAYPDRYHQVIEIFPQKMTECTQGHFEGLKNFLGEKIPILKPEGIMILQVKRQPYLLRIQLGRLTIDQLNASCRTMEEIKMTKYNSLFGSSASIVSSSTQKETKPDAEDKTINPYHSSFT